jgi:hypothetical protein
MPVPAVSPHNWKRTKIIAHFHMAVPMSMINSLSFEDRLTQILNETEGDIVEKTEDNKKANNNGSYCYHTDFTSPNDNPPYVVNAELDRNEPHRPRVKDYKIGKLKTSIKREKSNIPVDKFDFDDNLSVLLDMHEDFFKTLHCKLSVE